VADYLAGNMSPQDYIAQIRPGCTAYNGYNLVLGDAETLIWFSNRGDDDARNGQPLEPGIYGLSNALLDAPWPKVPKTKAQFASLLCQGAPDDAFSTCWPTPPAPRLPLARHGRAARPRARAVRRLHRNAGLRHAHLHRRETVCGLARRTA
jgi:hypothetical protein